MTCQMEGRVFLKIRSVDEAGAIIEFKGCWNDAKEQRYISEAKGRALGDLEASAVHMYGYSGQE